MKPGVRPPAMSLALAFCAILPAMAAAASGGPNRDTVLATVNGEPVPLHRVRAARGEATAPGEASKTLERMIGVELAVQEGYRMGLDETLEVRDQMGVFERDTLRDGLFAGRLQGLQPDPKQVEAMQKAMTREVRIRSAAFSSREDAERLVSRAARGEDFDRAAAEIGEGGKGKVDPGEGFILMADLLPAVQAAVAPLAAGGVSRVYPIDDRFAVTRLLESRPHPDPDARARAEAEVVRRLQADAIARYAAELRKKYAKVDEALFAALDFDAPKPGFESYLADGRTLVTIAGGEPIMVRDLADAVRKRLFHGADRAAEKSRLNRKKAEVLDDLIAKKVVLKEAVARGLDRRPEYLALRLETEREFVFGAFIAKVIEPEVKITDTEVAAWYQAHRGELTGPDMVRLEGIAFGSRKDAEAAFGKLRAGADPAWMKVNAPGRLDPASHPELLGFPATPVMVSDLPAGLRQALANAASGEYRLYTAPDATYVILVREQLPGRPMSLESVQSRIRGKLMGEKRQKVFDDYVTKLRKAAEVRTLVTPDQLEKLLASVPAS